MYRFASTSRFWNGKKFETLAAAYRTAVKYDFCIDIMRDEGDHSVCVFENQGHRKHDQIIAKPLHDLVVRKAFESMGDEDPRFTTRQRWTWAYRLQRELSRDPHGRRGY